MQNITDISLMQVPLPRVHDARELWTCSGQEQLIPEFPNGNSVISGRLASAQRAQSETRLRGEAARRCSVPAPPRAVNLSGWQLISRVLGFQAPSWAGEVLGDPALPPGPSGDQACRAWRTPANSSSVPLPPGMRWLRVQEDAPVRIALTTERDSIQPSRRHFNQKEEDFFTMGVGGDKGWTATCKKKCASTKTAPNAKMN